MDSPVFSEGTASCDHCQTAGEEVDLTEADHQAVAEAAVVAELQLEVPMVEK